MNSRSIIIPAALAALFVSATAAAQEAPPPAPMPTPPAATTPTATAPATIGHSSTAATDAAAAQTPAASTEAGATTTLTSAEPPVPMQPQTEERANYLTPHDRCGLINPSCTVAHFSVAIDGGISNFNESGPFGFNTGVGSISSTGEAWGLRVGLDIKKWLAVDAHYSGMDNKATGNVAMVTTGGTGEVRLTAPIPYVQPYALVGAGIYHTGISGSDSAQARSQLFGSTEFGMPLGVGLNVPIADGVSAGAELVYHRFFGESFAKDDNVGGGDLTTMNAVVRARL